MLLKAFLWLPQRWTYKHVAEFMFPFHFHSTWITSCKTSCINDPPAYLTLGIRLFLEVPLLECHFFFSDANTNTGTLSISRYWYKDPSNTPFINFLRRWSYTGSQEAWRVEAGGHPTRGAKTLQGTTAHTFTHYKQFGKWQSAYISTYLWNGGGNRRNRTPNPKPSSPSPAQFNIRKKLLLCFKFFFNDFFET